MIAQMKDDSMRVVVQGPENRSRGIVSCRVQRTERYDHKREHAKAKTAVAGANPKMLEIWDFLLEREDGSCVCLHPHYSDTKISCKHGVPEKDHEVPSGPRGGRGGTSGPGTFKYFKY